MALAALASLLPCPLCDARPAGPRGACSPCLATLPARAVRDRPGEVPLLWLGGYGGVLRRAVRAVKYGGRRRLGATLGARVGAAVVAAGWPVGRIAAVPLHPARRRRRGYDQARVLAAAAGARLGAPFVPGVRRVRATRRQARLHGPRRAANVAGAFAADRVAPVPVLLVDDVWTTGATARACRAALLAAGAREVRVAVVARADVPGPAHQRSTATVSPPTSAPTRTWG
jgi:predicted amidophosphoribosyltransferase